MKTCVKNHQYNSNLKCCPECRKLSNLAWYAKNKNKSIVNSLARYNSKKEEIKQQRKISHLNKTPEQKQKSRDRKNKYRRERYANDINFRLSLKLRARISRAVKNHSESLTKNFGCTIDELKAYLQSKFLPGMTWDNYGKAGWHIDHIKSLENFDLSQEDEVKDACKYTNLLPRCTSGLILQTEHHITFENLAQLEIPAGVCEVDVLGGLPGGARTETRSLKAAHARRLLSILGFDLKIIRVVAFATASDC
jgi:hypothetical protein